MKPDVILADDDAALRGAIRQMLERRGHRVLEAANGRAALEAFEHCPGAVVLLDVVMPEMEGLETLGHFRRRHPEARVIVMSGGSRGVNAYDALKMARALGALVTLSKPFTAAELFAAVDQAASP